MSDTSRFLAASRDQAVVPDFATNANQPTAPVAAPSWAETIDANWTLARQDQAGARLAAEDAELTPVAHRLAQLPDDRPWWQRLTGNGYLRDLGAADLLGPSANLVTSRYDRDAIYAGMAAHPELFKELPFHDDASLAAYVHGKRAGARAAAQGVVARETGAEHVLGFGTGMAAGFTDPINLTGMALTGGIAGGARTLIGGAAREALVNGALTAAQEPAMIASRHEFGEQTTVGDVATDIAEGTAGGALFHVGGAALKAGTSAIGRLLGGSDADVAADFTKTVPPGNRTPDQQAALNVVGRQADIDATNPFQPTPAGQDMHAAQLTDALQRLATLDVPKPAGPGAVPRETAGGVPPVGGPGAAPAIDLSPNRVIRFVMGDLEGGAQVVHYSDADGGTTKYGIAAHANPGVDVTNLTADQAASIARRKFWLPEYDRADPRTAAVAFDAGYIGGPNIGRRILHDSGGDPERALALYRGFLDHVADTVPGKERFRVGWQRRIDKLARFVGGSDTRVELRPEGFDGNDDALAGAQRDLDRADMDAQMAAQEAAMAGADEPTVPTDGAELPPVMEGSALGEGGDYFSRRIEGGPEQVVTARGRPIDTQFEVREAADLIDSGNPAFDQRLQPRDRAGRAASDVQVAAIAGNLDPAQLASSRLASQGAPIVGADGMVESGNGRVSAIRRAYADHSERADAYRRMVEERHPEAVGMQEPVLVRRRTSELSPADRRAWVAEANERDTMGMSPAEQAQADARALTPEVMASYRGGELTDARNRPFVRAFLDHVVPGSEHNTVTDDTGALNGRGLQRINDAMLARAYPAPDLIAKLTEAADTNIKAIGDVLRRLAAPVSQLRDLIAAERIDAQFDLSEPLAEVAQRVSAARDAGTPIDDIARQRDMFGGEPSPEVVALLRLFFRADEDGRLTRPRSADTVADAIADYVADARQGADFFGHVPTAEELIYAKRSAVSGADEGQFAATGRAGDGVAADGGEAERSGGSRGAGGDLGRPDAGADLARDLAEARGEAGPPPLDDPHLARFDDPAGEGAEAVADSLEHDARAELAVGELIEVGEEDGWRKFVYKSAAGHEIPIEVMRRRSGGIEIAIDEKNINGANRLGVRELRKGMQLLRQHFPDAEYVYGERTTGAGPGRSQLVDLPQLARHDDLVGRDPQVSEHQPESAPALDRGEAVDPAIAERQRQEAQLGAASPLRTAAERDGTIGLGLFDHSDQPGFRLEEEGGERPLADLLGEIDGDAAALTAARACL